MEDWFFSQVKSFWQQRGKRKENLWPNLLGPGQADGWIIGLRQIIISI